MKIPFPKLKARLTGISTPLGGIQWDYRPSETHKDNAFDGERDRAMRLLTYLEDK